MSTLHWLSPAALSIAATLAIAPTASAQARHHFVAGHSTEETREPTIQVAPPAPRVDVRPPRPFADAVWTDGFWSWSGNAYIWIAGAWVHGVPGRRWTPWRWEQSHGGWVLIPGGWVPSHAGHL